MKRHFLNFEKPIAELITKVDELHNIKDRSQVDIAGEISQLEAKVSQLTKEIYTKLTPWEISQVARHPARPRSLDYINNIFTQFTELHGDRHYGDDKAIITGLAKLDKESVMIIAQQKGRDTKENLYRNFGMPRPEGYRKALRAMKLAEKFHLPVISLIDTSGAYPGIGAEEHNQSEAIGKNLYELTYLKVPIICTIIGEGGSGGALAIAIGDQINMLEYAIYSVISPEGGASILWKDASKANIAAEILGITAPRLKALNLIDNVITEPLGGAHANPADMIAKLKKSLKEQLKKLNSLEIEAILNTRFERILSYGKFEVQETSSS